MRVFATLLLILIASQAISAASPAKGRRRLLLPAWAKNALKGAANSIITTILNCIATQVKSMGVAKLKMIPGGASLIGGKLVGKAIDGLTNNIKKALVSGIDGVINKLRRNRRQGLFGAIGGAFNAAKGAIGNLAGKAAAFAKEAGKVAGNVANAVHGVAAQVNKLTGGKLAAALQNMVCPLFGKGVQTAATAALTAVGWPFGVPACLIQAIVNGCKAAVKAGFKRHLRRLAMIRAQRRLAVATIKRRLALPAWAKNALKGSANAIIATVMKCIADQVKSVGVAQLSKIPGVKMVGTKLVGAAIDSLSNRIKDALTKAVDGAISKLRRNRRANIIGNIGNALGNLAGKVKAFAGEAAKVAGNVANAVQGVAKKLDKLTGGKLSAALQNMVCPLIGKGVQTAATAALTSVGWPFGVPACMITAVVNGCKAAVKAGLKRHLRRLAERAMLKNRRRLLLPAWAKSALKGAANSIITTILNCIATQVKSMGVAKLKMIPGGASLIGGKLVGKAIDGLTNNIKKALISGIDGVISKLRRNRRNGLFGAIGGAFNAAKNAVGNLAGKAAAFAKSAAAVAGNVANAVHGVAAQINKLTGGKLAAALQNMVCPLFGKGVQTAATAALTAVGWPFGVPACLIQAITNGCKAAVKAGFKRHVLRMRRLALVA